MNQIESQRTNDKSSNNTVNHFPKKEGESALNYVKSQRESKYKEGPKPFSAYATFEPIPNIKRSKNTIAEFYKQREKEKQHEIQKIRNI